MTYRVVGRRLRDAVDVMASLTMVAIGALLLYSYLRRAPITENRNEPPSEPVDVSRAFREGDPTAPIVLAVYSDFQCPYCAKFAKETLPVLREKYVGAGHLQVVFKDFPLDSLHPEARRVAAAARCAGQQGKFWEMHDLIFAAPRAVSASELESHASTLGLEIGRYAGCLTDPEVARRVAQDAVDARRLGLASTPTLLLGRLQPDGSMRARNKLVGAASADRIAREVDTLLAEQR